MKLSPIKGFGLCIMLKCLNSDKPNKVLTEEENHSKENENHSKENDGLIPKQSSNRSNTKGMRNNTQLKPQNYSPWVSAVDIKCDGPATNVRYEIFFLQKFTFEIYKCCSIRLKMFAVLNFYFETSNLCLQLFLELKLCQFILIYINLYLKSLFFRVI